MKLSLRPSFSRPNRNHARCSPRRYGAIGGNHPPSSLNRSPHRVSLPDVTNPQEPSAVAPEPGIWSRVKGAASNSILDQLVEVRRPQTELQKEKTRDRLLKHFIADVMGGSITVSRDTEMMINARIAQIDHLLSAAE